MRISISKPVGSQIACLLLPLLAVPCPMPGADEANDLQAVELSYAPAPADNPLKGFVPFRGNYESAGNNEESSAFPHSVEWAYFPLSAVMTGPDEYDFDGEFTKALDEISGRRHQAALRFYLDYPKKPTGVPQFLIDDGLKMNRYDDHGGGRSPDYSDDNLIIALEAFIAAFGERYDGDPRIAYVTLGLLGFWGEWHTYPHEDWFASANTQERILRAWTTAFSTTHLLMRTPQPDASKWPIGLHDDSFGYTTLGPEDWHFLPIVNARKAGELWRKQPIGGEVRPEVQALLWPTNQPAKFDEEIEVENFSECVRQTHASWLINQHVFENFSQLSKTAREQAIAAARSLGYELHVAKAVFPKSLGPGVDFEVSINIENRGVAPFYQDWPIELKIGKLRHTTKWRLSEIHPNAKQPTEWKTDVRLPADVGAGIHSLQLLAIPPLANGLPLRFANEEQQSDGWLTLGEISVSEQK